MYFISLLYSLLIAGQSHPGCRPCVRSRLLSCFCLFGLCASLIIATSQLHNIKDGLHGLPFQRLADMIEISNYVKESKQTSKHATQLKMKSSKSLLCDIAFE